ncbi:MAG: PilZ domain-containing protein [Bdellovibrionaceae bacterium]|nr:PilZ domain-containing protein [Pseudobdellovibrionaceae bacterium]
MGSGSSLQPRALRRLAIFFLIAPFGNILLSLFLGGQSIRSFPDALSLLSGIAFLDWLWLGLMFLSGILLLIHHKTAWLLAVLTLFMVITLNVSSLLESEGTGLLGTAQEIQVLFSVFLSCSVLIVLFYARYPYIDRRQGWFGPTAERFDYRVPVRLVGDEIHLGETESLSLSGCRIRLSRSWGKADRLRFVEVAFPDCEGVRIKAQVVGVQDSTVRLKFRDFIIGQKTDFERWVEGLASRQG